MDRMYVRQLVRAFQTGQMSRRDFLKRATLAVGSAAAVQLLAACGATEPPPAEPEDQDAVANPESLEGLSDENIRYPGSDGSQLMGYLVRPAEAENAPAVVVIQEWWGLNEHIRDVARRFAQAGFVALAPDLYDGQVATEPGRAETLAMELDMQQAVQEIDDAARFLLDQEYVGGEGVGIVGFCLGGRLVLQTALVSDNLNAAVAFYGFPLTPEEVTNIKAPIQGHYGTEDASIPLDPVRAMEEALQGTDIAHEIYIYEGAGHAFFNDTRESYRPEAADEAWTRTLAWFNDRLP